MSRYPAFRHLAAALWLAVAAVPALAQPATPFERGVDAFRAGQYEEARRAFEAALAADSDAAEAHYMLARIFHETPLRDAGRARTEIRQARRLDPNNLQYMVAELQQLREPSWSKLLEFIQEDERRELASQILALDSTNAFAHEDLGRSYIRDFWLYRNAIALPDLAYASRGPVASDDPDNVQNRDLSESSTNPTPGGPSSTPESLPFPPDADLGTPGALPVSDRFDLATLQQQGVPVVSLSRRADAAYERAITHLRAALRYDPRRKPVYTDVMRLALLRDDIPAVLPMLSQMLGYFPEEPSTWLYLGLSNYRLGRLEAADRSFDQAFGRMADDERAAYEDLGLLLTPGERDAYEREREAYSRRYWASQDPRLLTSFNERRLEHYARVAEADLLYAAEDVGKRGWETQRGQLHIRYGPPAVDVTITGNFERVVGDLGEAPDGQDLFGVDMAGESNLFNVWDYGDDLRFVFEDPIRNGEFRLYSPPANAFGVVGAGNVDRLDFELRARRAFREEPARYTYEAPGRQVQIPYLVTAFRGEGGNTDLLVHYGIPLADASAAGIEDLTIRTGAFVVDDEREVLSERRRTLYGLRPEAVVMFNEAQLWTDTQVLATPPGRHDVSVEFETASGQTTAAQKRAVDVPAFNDAGVQLSDVLLAYGIEEAEDLGIDEAPVGSVLRGGLLMRPAPWSVFSRRQPVYLYFETYNSDAYDVRATLRSKEKRGGLFGLFGGRARGVSAEFAGSGAGRDYTILDASGLEPGLFTLTLRVTDRQTGRSAERRQDLFLEE